MLKFNGARRAGPALLLLAALVAAPACTKVRGHQGYLADAALVESVQVGVDTRESVTQTLGRPSFVGTFSDQDWYYVSRTTRQYAYNQPRPSDQLVLHVRFNPAGTVTQVRRTGLEQVASISPSEQETPTLGRNRSFFSELFGNIGTVGAAGAPGAPTGNRPN